MAFGRRKSIVEHGKGECSALRTRSRLSGRYRVGSAVHWGEVHATASSTKMGLVGCECPPWGGEPVPVDSGMW